MYSNRGSAANALTSVERAYKEVAALQLDGLSPTDLYTILTRLDQLDQQRVALNRKLIGRLVAEGGRPRVGGTSSAKDLARRLRISPGEAQRRISEAAARS